MLHSFAGGTDGSYPGAGLIEVDGTLYGTTFSGGSAGFGTVFSISTSGAETVVHDFAGGSDGAELNCSVARCRWRPLRNDGEGRPPQQGGVPHFSGLRNRLCIVTVTGTKPIPKMQGAKNK